MSFSINPNVVGLSIPETNSSTLKSESTILVFDGIPIVLLIIALFFYYIPF